MDQPQDQHSNSRAMPGSAKGHRRS